MVRPDGSAEVTINGTPYPVHAEDTAQSAAWLVDALRATGRDQLIERAVTVLSAPDRPPTPPCAARLHGHFGQLTRTILDVPGLAPGGPIA